MPKAMLFNIQRFSLHDGPGIRTTLFFKGCPLHCLWCHNPESQNPRQEMLYDRETCVLCGVCQEVCPQNAVMRAGDLMVTDLEKCNFCGKCVIHCIPASRQIAGREYTVEEVVAEAIKDRVFYQESNGGLTLSGGEPLMQIDFVEELLRCLQEEGIHTAVDTCGFVPFGDLERAAKHTDLFLYDLKLMDDPKHREWIGVSNQAILSNLERLTRIHPHVILRMPIIEGVNTETKEIAGAISFIGNLDLQEVHLLPYHSIAKHKYSKLGREYQETKMQVPSLETINGIQAMLLAQGIKVKKEGYREGLYGTNQTTARA